MSHHAGAVRRGLAGLLVCLGLVSDVEAQTVKGAELKAAFLANFSKFTDWPPEALPPGDGFSYCVIEDKAVAAALEGILKARPGDPHKALSVRVVKIDPSIRSCHMVYAGKLGARESVQLLDLLKDTPAFTVGDGEGFAAAGGVAQFMVENGRIRFAINVAAASRAGLTLSSKLLGLATLVKDAR
jgi:YfiR/HmsC-like